MKPQRIKHDARRVMEITGCTAEEAPMVEDILREDIFHSTLDWQMEEQFRQGAQLAWRLFQENREEYNAFYQGVREALLAGQNAANER